MTDTIERPCLHHVTLKTTRLDEMIAWYAKAVGMVPNFRFDGGAWMSNDTANHRVALLTAPGVRTDDDKIAHDGIHHLAFEYDTLDGLLSTYERLKIDGIEPHAALDHGITTSLYYVDPDGNSIELQTDNFDGDWDASSDFMRTAPAFAANPIGVHFDPSAMAAAWRESADPAELHRRCYDEGEFAPDKELDLRLPV